MAEAKERGSSSRAEDGDSKASRQMMHDVEEEDSTVLGDEAKPPRRASVGWGTEESDEKGGGSSTAASGAATAETKRPGRRRKGGDGGSSSSGADSKQQRNRHFDDDDRDATGTTLFSEEYDSRPCVASESGGMHSLTCCVAIDIVEIPDLEEEEREPDITTQGQSSDERGRTEYRR
ncbi:hypothetical protein PINS_up005815 [Pythium insidiosum]|nr:hypothetical protein PINS_up005815 [Pythium insidiosum]